MASIARLALSPYVTGAALLILRYGPDSVREELTRFLGNNLHLLSTSLKWLLALGLTSKINSLLSRWAENKWIWKNEKTSWKWDSEIAVVTGGSNGIGAHVVRGLVARGVKVAVLDIQPLSKDLEDLESVHFYKCDITSREAVQQAAEAIRSDLGNPSILINNAGMGTPGTILDQSSEDLRKIFDVNLISHFYTVQEFLPDMLKQRKGHIMSVASLASFAAAAGMVNYACTKAGVLAFHEGLNQELKHRFQCPEIKTTVVHPGWTRTNLTAPLEGNIKKAGIVMLDPEVVADAMVKQIFKGESAQIILPENMKNAAGLRGGPTWLQELLLDKSKDITILTQ
ncbi:hypothetical protein H2199_005580 [Coniosporium tulheliwenetii]|uniref:Uncharacterized protein n=1 Tax=Coniosporium tulheliwenetii TaxID=3383036 RepID=A0ACC2YZT8_9PEZI|nr:hypothetical protein H2199_005580 [Cladosporium sp. JES 115]